MCSYKQLYIDHRADENKSQEQYKTQRRSSSALFPIAHEKPVYSDPRRLRLRDSQSRQRSVVGGRDYRRRLERPSTGTGEFWLRHTPLLWFTLRESEKRYCRGGYCVSISSARDWQMLANRSGSPRGLQGRSFTTKSFQKNG